MSDKDNRTDAANQQEMKLEDLLVDKATTEQVKGGPGFIVVGRSG